MEYLLKDFLFFKIDKEKLTRMKNIYDEMLKYTIYKPLDDEYEAPISYLKEIAKPIQDKKMGLIKEILNTKTIAFIVFAIIVIAILLCHETIVDILLSIDRNVLIGVVVGGIIVGLVLKVVDKIPNIFKRN